MTRYEQVIPAGQFRHIDEDEIKKPLDHVGLSSRNRESGTAP